MALPEWIQKHLDAYLATDGRDGHMFDTTAVGGPGPVPCLLLTTTGRKSGDLSILPLIYGDSEAGPVIVASKGGAPAHPVWYLNLEANASVEVQILGEKYRAQARVLEGSERETLWSQLAELYPPYNDYQAKTSREIPVVVLERKD
jgi:proline iminopeptidase